jgi:NAD(P)-dependent dehydrogenase (short-subunit alcohol dehydrogenase family)
MGSKRVLVVGAAGDVEQGIVAEALQSGWRVIAAGRTKERLEALDALGGGVQQLATVVGDLGSEAGAAALWTAAETCFEGIDVSGARAGMPRQQGGDT